MKQKLIFSFLLLAITRMPAQLQETLHATVNLDGGPGLAQTLDPACASAEYVVSYSLTDWSEFSLRNINTSGVRCSARVFSFQPTAHQKYAALSLSVNTSSAFSGNGGLATISYSFDGGKTWKNSHQTSATTAGAETGRLSPNQDLSLVKVAVGVSVQPSADGEVPSIEMVRVWDISAIGTLSQRRRWWARIF